MESKIEIPTETITSLPDFLEYVASQSTGERNVLFRGHTESPWKLEPKIARLKLRNSFSLQSAEKEILRDFKRQALPYASQNLKDNWDWLALAQHHGLYTRLLDWTTNALVALWFAVEKPAKVNTDGAVWIFLGEPSDYVDEEQLIDPFSVKRTLIFRPRHLTARIIAQSGWFTIHRLIPDRKHGFVPLEKNKKQNHRLRKIEIPGWCFPILREDLSHCGINSGSLFADLNGISREIMWNYSPLEDEKKRDNELGQIRKQK